MNITMLVKNRPQLTHQALRTLALHTDVEWNLVIINDHSTQDTTDMLMMFAGMHKNVALLRLATTKGITGQIRNLSVYWAEKYWGRGEWLVLCDNDVCFTPGWASKLIAAMEDVNAHGVPLLLLGGQNHPYHKPIHHWRTGNGEVREYYAVAGTCQLMPWSTWDAYGPLDANAPGVCQSEDTAFSNRIREAGGKVGALWPHVVLDTGIHQTDGTLSIGADQKEQVEGVLFL